MDRLFFYGMIIRKENSSSCMWFDQPWLPISLGGSWDQLRQRCTYHLITDHWFTQPFRFLRVFQWKWFFSCGYYFRFNQFANHCSKLVGRTIIQFHKIFFTVTKVLNYSMEGGKNLHSKTNWAFKEWKKAVLQHQPKLAPATKQRREPTMGLAI